MNPHQFKSALKKLVQRTPRTAEVLWMLLNEHTYADIAESMGIHPGTVRKHTQKIYKAFGIEGEFEGDRRSRRCELTALFANYKSEWLSTRPSTVTNTDCLSTVTKEVSNQGAQETHSSQSPPVSSTTKGEDLMFLATRMLEQLGFDQKFKVRRASQYVGYQLKNPGVEAKRYQLVLAQRKEGLCISICQDILNPYILKLNYWVFIDEIGEASGSPVGMFWVLPSQKDIFLEKMNPNYWSLFENERVEGNVYLNSCESNGYMRWVIPGSDIIPRNEFSPDTLSDTDTYLVLRNDNLFPYTWQAFITSSEVLEEFVGHFAKILIENQ